MKMTPIFRDEWALTSAQAESETVVLKKGVTDGPGITLQRERLALQRERDEETWEEANARWFARAEARDLLGVDMPACYYDEDREHRHRRKLPQAQALLILSKQDMMSGQLRRFGKSNPEVLDMPFYHALVRSRVDPHGY